MLAVDVSSVGTLTCVGESVVGMIHSFNNLLRLSQQVLTSSSSDIKNNKIITTIYYGNNKILDS